jgi:hypothetical protein
VKYIFLDIDGVLWTMGWSVYARRATGFGHVPPEERERREYEEWDPIACSNLQWVLERGKEEGVDIKIVVSSTWRLSRSVEELKEIAKKSGLDPDAIVGVTPYFRGREFNTERGYEIQAWMDENKVSEDDIVIIDDDSDMAHLLHKLVKTDSYDGLGFRKAIEVAKRLGVRD